MASPEIYNIRKRGVSKAWKGITYGREHQLTFSNRVWNQIPVMSNIHKLKPITPSTKFLDHPVGPVCVTQFS